MQSSNESETADFTSEQLESIQRLDKIKDHYDLLGVSRGCSKDDLKKAYKTLALKFHPDKNQAPGSSEAFKSINLAFSVLSNPAERRKYEESQWEDVDVPRYKSRTKYNSHHHDNPNHDYQQYENHCFDFFYSEHIFDDEFFNSFFANQSFRTKYTKAKEKASFARSHSHNKKQQPPQQPSQQQQSQQQSQQKFQQQKQTQQKPRQSTSHQNSNNKTQASTASQDSNRSIRRHTNMNLMVQLSPFFFIITLSLFNALLTHEPPYALTQNGKYVVKRHTSRLNIAFYTRENFKDSQLERVEQRIEEEQLHMLRKKCLYERNERDMQLWRAKMRNDRPSFMQAKDKTLHYCTRLQELVVSY